MYRNFSLFLYLADLIHISSDLYRKMPTVFSCPLHVEEHIPILYLSCPFSSLLVTLLFAGLDIPTVPCLELTGKKATALC